MAGAAPDVDTGEAGQSELLKTSRTDNLSSTAALASAIAKVQPPEFVVEVSSLRRLHSKRCEALMGCVKYRR